MTTNNLDQFRQVTDNHYEAGETHEGLWTIYYASGWRVMWQPPGATIFEAEDQPGVFETPEQAATFCMTR